MGWFIRSSRRKAAATHKADIWANCPSCSAHVFKQEWEETLRVCPKCNHHDRLTSEERINLLTDENTFSEQFADVVAADPLEFADGSGSYAAKLESTRRATGLSEAVRAGRAQVKGIEIVLVVMDFRFIGGSLSSGAGERIALAAELALKRRLPLVVVSTSGGARMQEGMVSLMQMAKTCAVIGVLQRAGLPYISILTSPTYGGVSASYALLGDINMAEPGALIGFAGRRVIEQTIKHKLPPDFQTAEYLLDHGFLDMIVNRSELKDRLHAILQYWRGK